MMSSPQSSLVWLGTATDFRVVRFFQDFRGATATLDIEIKGAYGSALKYGFEFKRNDVYDSYEQKAPDMKWKIFRMYLLVQ